ncbi:hypothetical protein FHX41_4488 [Actinomadura hallensis]|uniref:Uncharacterized protein n=1 Tax=Actinomadura hallensis TaxID=337895 RepID=A0A543IJK6_9ACTN|nr:hypothetical protein [Actinomadura hallensis]TQM70752.1 hypothetical protein FHX41_4488 [Actinomadura hallensis]
MFCAALAACGGGPGTSGPPASAPSASTASPSPSGEPEGERLVLRWRRTGGVAGVGGPSAEAAFLKRLDPDGWPPADLAAPPRPYVPERTAVLAGEIGGDGADARPWPLGPLGDGVRAAGGVCTLAPTVKVPGTAPGIVWRSEGEVYSVRLRPLLPGESSCADLD